MSVCIYSSTVEGVIIFTCTLESDYFRVQRFRHPVHTYIYTQRDNFAKPSAEEKHVQPKYNNVIARLNKPRIDDPFLLINKIFASVELREATSFNLYISHSDRILYLYPFA